MKSAILSISLALVLALGAWPLALSAFTPIRPLSALKEQNADHVVASAPISAQVTVPRRYVVGKDASIANLTSLTNALTNGQLLLQQRIKELDAECTPLRELKTNAKKTEKNFEKLLKSIEKAKKQAQYEEELAFYLLLEEIITSADASSVP